MSDTWERTQRYARILHNRSVKKHFRDIKTDSKRDGRGALKTAMLIDDKDSAMQVLVKMQLFRDHMAQTELVASLPDTWQLRIPESRPQLAIIYRIKDKTKKTRSGNYTLHIPHYEGSRKPQINPYQKGNYWARMVCKDNSKLVVYAKTQTEAKETLRELSRYVSSKFRTQNITLGKLEGDPYKIAKAVPLRADYYKHGHLKGAIPTWRTYL